MTALLLYGSVIMMGLCLWIRRVGNRRLAAIKRALKDDGETLKTLQDQLQEAQRTRQAARQQCADLDERIETARKAVAATEGRLAQAKAAPVERYFVFDRADPRPGIIWAVEVRRPTGAVQRYLVSASGQREAEERVVQRFPRNAGYSLGRSGPCRLFRDRKAEAVDASSPAADRERPVRMSRLQAG